MVLVILVGICNGLPMQNEPSPPTIVSIVPLPTRRRFANDLTRAEASTLWSPENSRLSDGKKFRLQRLNHVRILRTLDPVRNVSVINRI